MKKLAKITGGFVLALVVISGCTAAMSDTESTPEDKAAEIIDDASNEASADEETEPVAEEEPTEEPEPAVEEEPAEPEMTTAQANAVRKADDYLSMSGFSKSGLIEQLQFEGYSKADATFAIKAIKPNWNEHAARKAQDYVDMSGFSRSGLIEQLMFEGFTRSQAEHGANAVGL